MIPIAEGDPPSPSISLARSLVLGAPRAYAVLFFSANERLGWWLMAISMLAPDLGLAGLAGVCASGALAWWLGYDRANIRNGFLLFNPLLVCLTLAFLHRCYQFQPHTYCLLWSASVIGSFFLSVAMQQWIGANFGLSAHSLPAVVAAYVLYFLGFSLLGSPVMPAVTPHPVLDLPFFPPFWEVEFQAFGAMLFQPRVLPGLLVLAGLAVTSPLSTLVASASIAVGAGTMMMLGFQIGPSEITWCGFNFLLCGIALGAGYFITSPASVMLALAGAALCALVSLAVATALRYFNLPASALPYNLVVLTLVYALRQRKSAGALCPSPAPGTLPESAARQVLIQGRRFPHLRTPALTLPFIGQRVITQGFDGSSTHRGRWRYAFDFEAERDGSRHQGSGEALADFHVYDTPVLSPCAGTVAFIVNHVRDNAPGANNTDENWGNCVILFSDAGYYVLLAHFKPGSCAVHIGQRVHPGVPLGLCGNSGRSPVPHLHLQIQREGFPGSATLPFCLKHYLEAAPDGTNPVHHTSGIPVLGVRIQPPTPNFAMSEALSNWLPGEYRYRIAGEKGATWEETILIDFDELGRYRLRSRRTHSRLTAFLAEGIFYTTDFEGSHGSLLAWIATGLARLPCIADAGATWTDHVSSAPFFPPLKHWTRGIIEPFLGPFLLKFIYRMEQNPAGVLVRATFVPDAQDRAQPPAHAPREILSHVNGRRGVVRLEARMQNDQTFTAELLDWQPAA